MPAPRITFEYPQDKKNKWKKAASKNYPTIKAWAVDKLEAVADGRTIELTPGQAESIKKFADLHGLPVPDLVKKAISFLADFSTDSMELLEAGGAKVNAPSGTYAQNKAIAKMAMDDAEAEVYPDRVKTLSEFMPTSYGLQTGKDLYARLKRENVEKLKRQRAAWLNMRKRAGSKLSDGEAAWLDAYYQKQADLQAELDRPIECPVEGGKIGEGVLTGEDIAKLKNRK